MTAAPDWYKPGTAIKTVAPATKRLECDPPTPAEIENLGIDQHMFQIRPLKIKNKEQLARARQVDEIADEEEVLGVKPDSPVDFEAFEESDDVGFLAAFGLRKPGTSQDDDDENEHRDLGATTIAPLPTPTPERSPQQVAADIVGEAFFEEELTLKDLLPYRVLVCWRITRELARLRGFCTHDTMLRQGLDVRHDNPDPWITPQAYKPPRFGVVMPSRNTLRLLIRADYEIKGDDRYSTLDINTKERSYYTGLAILPPSVPHKYLVQVEDPNTGKMKLSIDPNYKPHDDTALLYFGSIAQSIVHEFNIERGSAVDPNLGRYGLAGLLEVETIRVAWPTRMEIIYWEELLVRQVMDRLIKQSAKTVKRVLEAKYGLTPSECTMMVQLAKACLLDEMDAGDGETAKALMIAKLESYIERCGQALDLKSEIMGLKQLAVVQGLARMEADDSVKDIMDVIRNVSQERRARAAMPALEVKATEVPSEGTKELGEGTGEGSGGTGTDGGRGWIAPERIGNDDGQPYGAAT